MKVFLSFLLIIGLLVGCSSKETDKTVNEKEKVTESQKNDKKETAKETTTTEKTKIEEPKKEEAKKESPSIDTSVFEYAKDVEVTDSRNTTKHINVVVFMSKELSDGQAASHVLNQTYDFIQQADIKGAKTVTMGVMIGDKRVFQYTVDVAKFVPNDKEPMVDVVLAASKVEILTPAVEEFATAFQWKMSK
ncbi:hypothetical protein ACIFOT_20605 [Neobacillus sp. NRS-1170]|uniref:hypothetical protein n=1 Tax=Neobacillus sp. NRS-1170 TaxID=3233898 RepID=UPI003D2BDAD1